MGWGDWQDWLIGTVSVVLVLLWIVGVVCQWWQKEKKMAHVHFVGFRTDAQNSAAIKVWGRPDFVHKWHDKRMWGDIDPDNDIVVFAKGATLQPSKWTWQDHQIW